MSRASLALILAVFPACQPAPAEESDAGGGEPDPRTDAAAGEPDAALCELPGGSTAGNVVRVVYLLPSDVHPDDRHVRGLESAVRHVQLWYRERTGGITFEVFDPVVETALLPRPASYYPTNDSGREDWLWFWDNVNGDAFEVTGADYHDENHIWLFYIPIDAACGQATGATSGVALFGANDVRGLVGDPQVRICPDDDGNDPGRCRWVGGMATLLAYAIGLESPLNPWSYPDGELSQADRELLSDNRFFAERALPDCALDCSRKP